MPTSFRGRGWDGPHVAGQGKGAWRRRRRRSCKLAQQPPQGSRRSHPWIGVPVCVCARARACVYPQVPLQGLGGRWGRLVLPQRLPAGPCVLPTSHCMCRRAPSLHDLLHVHHVLFIVGLVRSPRARCLPVVVPSACLGVGVSASRARVCVVVGLSIGVPSNLFAICSDSFMACILCHFLSHFLQSISQQPSLTRRVTSVSKTPRWRRRAHFRAMAPPAACSRGVSSGATRCVCKLPPALRQPPHTKSQHPSPC